MNELTIFKNEQFGEMRTVTIGEEIWFVGKDVAEILGYKNSKDALITHVSDEDKRIIQRSEIATLENHLPKEVFPVNFTSGDIPNRGLTIINESGLYSLILSSKLQSAKEFKRWVTSEVLPSVRKHGAYMTQETIENVLLNPDTIITLAKQLKAERAKVAELQPKADYFDTVANSSGLTNFRETAKAFGVRESDFIRFIERTKLCYRNSRGKLIPYAEYLNKKWFEVKEVTYGPSDSPRTTLYTKITPLGRTEIFNKMRKAGGYEQDTSKKDEIKKREVKERKENAENGK